jgi:hypothetical protein
MSRRRVEAIVNAACYVAVILFALALFHGWFLS